MSWRRFAGLHGTVVVAGIGDSPAAAATPVPDCWVSTEGRRELRCLGRVDAAPDDVVDLWLWFTGTETAVDLTPGERDTLCAASSLRPLGPAEQERLLQRLGRRRAWAEHGRWGLWVVPVEEVEAVLAAALTRSARLGHPYPVVA